MGSEVMKCRYCESQLSNLVLSLNAMPLTDDFISINTIHRKEYLSDINIYECQKCGLVQNPIDFDHDRYYQEYQYSSGHSSFARSFMESYAKLVIEKYKVGNKKEPQSVLEIGSGDGIQLQQFLKLGIARVMGFEPSEQLAKFAVESGISTRVELFGKSAAKDVGARFDICISSYTLDHVRNPKEFLETAYDLLNDDGVLAFEVHDLEKIIERSEYCLFEHEHTIYMTVENAIRFVELSGFEVLDINPIPENEVRGNSLIVVAKKTAQTTKNLDDGRFHNYRLDGLGSRILELINRLDNWLELIPINEGVVGFGAGGRGVMTLSRLINSRRFSAILDSNYESKKFLTPKTHIRVVGPDEWGAFANAYCLVFSFGYFDEIKDQLLLKGFSKDKIISLSDFFN